MSGDWSLLLAGVGLGICLTLLALAPVLVKAWRLFAAEQERRIAERVAGILADNAQARRHMDQDELPARTGRPNRQRDAAEALLMKFADARHALEEFEADLAYVKNGGHPDDRPHKVLATLEKGKANK